MASTVKNALKGGVVVGGVVVGGVALIVVVVAALVLLPIILAAAWHYGWLSFETAAIVLLVLAAYSGAGDQ